MPRSAICTTSPSMPSSAITRLLPPPSTNNGIFRSVHQRCAAATSPAEAARVNQAASPPTPSVLSGASGTRARGSIAPSADGKELPFLGDQRGDGVGARAHLELEPVAGCQLRGQRQVGG